jgi:hypothetical protein
MNRQDGNGRFANDPLRNTAEQEVLHSDAAVRSHHDQVYVPFGGEVENLRSRVSSCDENLIRNSRQSFPR